MVVVGTGPPSVSGWWGADAGCSPSRPIRSGGAYLVPSTRRERRQCGGRLRRTKGRLPSDRRRKGAGSSCRCISAARGGMDRFFPTVEGYRDRRDRAGGSQDPVPSGDRRSGNGVRRGCRLRPTHATHDGRRNGRFVRRGRTGAVRPPSPIPPRRPLTTCRYRATRFPCWRRSHDQDTERRASAFRVSGPASTRQRVALPHLTQIGRGVPERGRDDMIRR